MTSRHRKALDSIIPSAILTRTLAFCQSQGTRFKCSVALLGAWSVLSPTFCSIGAQQVEWTLRERFRVPLANSVPVNERVAGFVVSQNRRVYVPLYSEGRVIAVDSSGQVVGTIGRDGDVAISLTELSGFGTFGDTLYMIDNVRKLIAYVKPLGQTYSERPFGTTAPDSELRSLSVSAQLADGSLFATPLVGREIVGSSAADSLPLWRMSFDGAILNLIARVAVPNSVVELQVGARLIFASLGPVHDVFDDSPLWKHGHDGKSVVVVDRRDEPGRNWIVVRRITVKGDTLFKRRYRFEKQPLPKKVVDSVFFEVSEALKSAYGSQAIAEQAVRHVVRPPLHRISVRKFFVSQDGFIWLLKLEKNGYSWTVLDSRGRFAARVEAPSSVVLTNADASRVWGYESNGERITIVAFDLLRSR